MNRALLAIASIAALCVSGATHSLDKTRPFGPLCLPDADQFRDGDIVFRRGRDLVSSAIIASDSKARFSHIGMIAIIDGKPMVMHSMPPEKNDSGGVGLETLDMFASAESASDFSAYSVATLDPSARKRIHSYLIRQLGKPFDFAFRYSDDSAHYCTELVLKALDHANLDLRSSLPRVDIMTMPEPAFTPDSVRLAPRLVQLPSNRRCTQTGASQKILTPRR